MRSEISRSDFVIGNAPTALLALCTELPAASVSPSLVIGTSRLHFSSGVEGSISPDTSQIRLEGRKGGSPVAAAILNALIVLAWEEERRREAEGLKLRQR